MKEDLIVEAATPIIQESRKAGVDPDAHTDSIIVLLLGKWLGPSWKRRTSVFKEKKETQSKSWMLFMLSEIQIQHFDSDFETSRPACECAVLSPAIGHEVVIAWLVFDCYRHICCHLIRGHSYLCDHMWFYFFSPCVLFLYKIEINCESLFILYEKNIHISSKMFFFQSKNMPVDTLMVHLHFWKIFSCVIDTFIKCYNSVEDLVQ